MDDTTDADKIRNKRLAKLGSQAQNNASSSTEQADSSSNASDHTTSNSSPKPTINITKVPTNLDINPFTQLGLKPREEGSREDAPRRSTSAYSPQQLREKPRSAKKEEPLEIWKDKNASTLFRITLKPENAKDIHGHPLYYLHELRNDLMQAEKPLLLSEDHFEDAIREAASQPTVEPLDYLLACWKRISRFLRSIKVSTIDDQKIAFAKTMQRLCMSYCIFAITIPDLFGRDEHGKNPLARHLLVDPESDRGICQDFLSEAVARFPEDESIKEVLVGAVEQLSRDLATKTMNDDYRQYVTALRNIARYPPLVEAMTESPYFLPPNIAAQDIETSTLLGPFFRISPMQGEVALNYFSSPKTRDRANIANAQNALRMTLQTHQGELFEIVDRFIKSSKDSRERMLDWFALTVNANHRRRAMRPDPRTTSSDGFMINVTVCLDRLCEPFMDATFSKIGRIEPEYFRRSPRVHIQDETKMNADQTTADSFYAQKADGVSNFISEIFFLTVAAHHYGTEAANSKLDGLRRDLKSMEKELAKFEGQRLRYANNPTALAHFDRSLQKYKDQIEQGHCVSHAIQGVLLDELSQARSMSFMRYIIVWLVRLVSGVEFPRKMPQLPLPAEQPDVFSCLPEYFLEDVVDHFKFVTGNMPQVIAPTQCDELVMICIIFMRSSEYIKNPGVKSGLVTILFHGVWPQPRHAKGVLGDVLNSLPFALQHLLHALMQSYIECEHSGSHTAFYDKFNIRYEIFQVFKCIWSNQVYRDSLGLEASVNTDFFVRYVNLLLNDVTFVLDESFSSFRKIHTITMELANSADLDEAAKAEKEEALEDNKKKAKSYMGLTNETLAMLRLFTDALASAFTTTEVVQRLADMLDYNLDSLVGPKQTELKIQNREEYKFDPLGLLGDLVDVYLNLAHKPSFHLAIARDGRSYKPENFKKAGEILSGRGQKSSGEIQRWEALCVKILEAKMAEDEEEEDLGEVPEDFLDPLMATIMIDPVTLPVSRTVMDRSTIRQHLLSDPHDPYSRAPLKIEEVLDNPERKAEIMAWKQERKAAKLAQQGETMDTSL